SVWIGRSVVGPARDRVVRLDVVGDLVLTATVTSPHHEDLAVAGAFAAEDDLLAVGREARILVVAGRGGEPARRLACRVGDEDVVVGVTGGARVLAEDDLAPVRGPARIGAAVRADRRHDLGRRLATVDRGRVDVAAGRVRLAARPV